jgi:sugar lactone lactonase YvrE
MGMSRVAAIAVGCVALNLNAASASADAATEARGLQPKVLSAFVSGQDIPESVTTDTHGNLYISLGNTIERRPPDGVFSVFATLPLPINALGVKVGPDGCVYNASTSLSAVQGAFVWRICGASSVEAFAELDQTGAPNDLAFDDSGSAFVTDPVLARIWKVDPLGNAEAFVDSPLLAGTPDDPALVFRALGANGIAFDREQKYLYVSNTDQGTIVRIEAHPAHHHAPAVSIFKKDTRLRGADGIAFDRDETLWVAVNAVDSLVSVDKHGGVRVQASGGLLDAPSSIVFGATNRDRDKLYLMSSAFSRTLGFQTGTPHPALLDARVSTPGLTLF